MGRLSQMKEALLRGFGQSPVSEPEEPPWWDRYPAQSPWPNARVVEHIVNNRVFLLGLDALYRNAMKKHERGELLACAQRVATALKALPEKLPVEGYYIEDPDLTSYFRLMRALQRVPLEHASEVESLPQFGR